MSENTDVQINLDRLREQIRPAVKVLTEKLRTDLAEDLKSLSVVGSAVTDDFHPKRSDINTILIVATRTHQLLKTIAGYGSAMGKLRLRAPLLMTDEYLQSSLDVFGIELLDFQLNHITVVGPDPLVRLTFQKQHIRLQCERELKAALIKLRQGYIKTLGKGKFVGELLIGCIGDLLPLLRGLLWLEEIERPRRAGATVNAAAEHFKFDLGPIAELVALKQQHAPPKAEQVESLFEKLYQTVDLLSRRVDKLRISP